MLETPPPPEDDVPHGALIDEGGRLTNWLMTRLREALAARAGQLLSIPFLRGLMRDYILPAEAALRRAIHLIANTLPPLGATNPPRTSCHPGESRASRDKKSHGDFPEKAGCLEGNRPRKLRKPLFRLTEPLPRPHTNYIPANQRPRISVAGDPPPPAREPELYTVRIERLKAQLRRRLAALTYAWEDPLRTAKRLQRLRARGRIRTPALSFLKIPGNGAETLGERGADILRELNTASFEDSVRLRTDTS